MTRSDVGVSDMADLFDPEPSPWGLRGDPHVWRALRDHLAGKEVPASVDEVMSLLRESFSVLVGLDVGHPMSSVYREQYAHGGMSSGMVCLDTWRGRLMPLLEERARSLLEP